MLQEIPRLGNTHPRDLTLHLGSEVGLSDARRDAELALWRRLKRENAPLRVLADGELISASIEVFDALLLENTTRCWKKMAWIIGSALGQSYEAGPFQVGDLVLSARLRSLAQDGTLEWRGDLERMNYCELRLVSSNE